jgi:hypothetical protein
MSPESSSIKPAKNEALLPYQTPDAISGEIDLSLLQESLRLTPWERMLANDDALNFAESLRMAMEKHHAKP